MTKVQLAVQGGGAKFINLLAAAEPFQAAQESRNIEITRVAGTSAGSIVAAIIAMGAPIPRVNEFMNIYGEKFVGQATSGIKKRRDSIWSKPGLYWDLYRGIPLSRLPSWKRSSSRCSSTH